MTGTPRLGSVSEAQPGTGWRHIVDDEIWLGRLMLAPAILYIALLIGAPFLLALYYSLTDITVGSSTMHFVGLQHFQEVMQTPKFLQALRNTFLFAFGSQLLVLILANILAQVLRYEFHGKWLVRCLILLPWVAPISLGDDVYVATATTVRHDVPAGALVFNERREAVREGWTERKRKKMKGSKS